jgi:hypothetical protein
MLVTLRRVRHIQAYEERGREKGNDYLETDILLPI